MRPLYLTSMQPGGSCLDRAKERSGLNNLRVLSVCRSVPSCISAGGIFSFCPPLLFYSPSSALKSAMQDARLPVRSSENEKASSSSEGEEEGRKAAKLRRWLLLPLLPSYIGTKSETWELPSFQSTNTMKGGGGDSEELSAVVVVF